MSAVLKSRRDTISRIRCVQASSLPKEVLDGMKLIGVKRITVIRFQRWLYLGLWQRPTTAAVKSDEEKVSMTPATKLDNPTHQRHRDPTSLLYCDGASPANGHIHLDHAPSFVAPAEMFPTSNSLLNQPVHTAHPRDTNQQETKWHSERSKSGFSCSIQRQRRKLYISTIAQSLSSQTPSPQTFRNPRAGNNPEG